MNKGYTCREIEDILLLDKKTIKRYKKVYEEFGINGLLQNNYKGGQSKLSKNQEDELIDYIENNLISSSSEICAHVTKEYGLRYTVPGVEIF